MIRGGALAIIPQAIRQWGARFGLWSWNASSVEVLPAEFVRICSGEATISLCSDAGAALGSFDFAPSTVWSGPHATAPDWAKPWLAEAAIAGLPLDGDLTVEHMSFEGTVIQTSLAGRGVRLVEFGGVLTTSTGAERLLRTRARLAGLAGIAATAWGALALVSFAARHPYFAASWSAALLLLIGAALPVLAIAVTAASLGPGSIRRRVALGAPPAAALVLLILGQAGVAGTSGPSVSEATALFSGGEAHEAERIAAAAMDLGIDADAAGALLDRIHIADLQASNALTVRSAYEATRWHTPAGDLQARQRVADVTLEEAVKALDSGSLRSVRAALHRVPEFTGKDPRLRLVLAGASLLEADECLEHQNAHCTFLRLIEAESFGASADEVKARRDASHEQVQAAMAEPWSVVRGQRHSLEDRNEACERLSPLLPAAALFAEGVTPAPTQVLTSCADLRRRLDDKLAREKAAAERAAAKEREAQAARDRARRWSMAPLRCRDGSYSPTCTCGGGSRRGCCSRHGGVAGCSQ